SRCGAKSGLAEDRQSSVQPRSNSPSRIKACSWSRKLSRNLLAESEHAQPIRADPTCSRKRKDRQRNRLGRSHDLAADRTAPEQVWQAPGLREFRLAESQQILPVIGNRKPASELTHWMQPVPCSSRRRSCPGRERGDRQSSVPADS